jgi:hypothetical protein
MVEYISINFPKEVAGFSSYYCAVYELHKSQEVKETRHVPMDHDTCGKQTT